jgi:type II secretory pathway pseudopilin PulG
MHRHVKGLLLGLGRILVALILVLGVLLAYVSFSERSASKKADSFCSAVALGSDTSTLLEAAVSQGADRRHTRWFHADGHDQLPVTFSGATPLSRHICWVEAAQGRVVSSRVVYLD